MIQTHRFESLLVVAISVAALGLTAAALLSPPQDEAASPAAAVGRAETPIAGGAPARSLAARHPQPGVDSSGKGLGAAPSASPSRSGAPTSLPIGQRCALHRWPPPDGTAKSQLRPQACEGPAAASRRLNQRLPG